MKHFIFFIIFIFGALSAVYFHKEDNVKNIEDKKIQVYASASFIAKWGPGPALKELFERQSLFKIEYIESSDINMTLQKINFENENSHIDVVLGMDQYDISRYSNKVKWRDIDRSYNTNFVSEVKHLSAEKMFIPYDWSPLSFIVRKNLSSKINNLQDLLKPEFKGKLALQDPRTSSPGLQFLVWIFESMPADEAVKYLKQLNSQVHSYSPSWSHAYGLFKAQQANLVFSYVTSPVYHLVEEKDQNYMSIEPTEPLPAQVEFAGIPTTCKNCEAAEMFANFLLTNEAQKIIMSKNYMLPVVDKVKEATAFDALKIYKTLPIKFYEQNKIEKWISTWSETRKNEGN